MSLPEYHMFAAAPAPVAPLENVVSARAFLTDFHGDYERFNAVYASYFPKEKRPARTCIGTTGLARHALVEIDFIARRP
ncbi:MAG: hypothetical protein CVV08_11085 [Gammaproteobacteria bacterium HGW-Gammaproteobacteria-12]|nr:MAG: hypothetical protein CVV08_11085 [Gammaproteobacteria bacterium HGW-Gammaproteobacteria-12]